MAIHAAKEKAVAVAAELGVRVGEPSNINVNDWGGWTSWSPGNAGYGGGGGSGQNVSQNAGGGSGETGATFAVGQITVSANVSVSFLIK